MTDTTLVVMILLFGLSVIFTFIGLNYKAPWNIIGYTIATVVWFVVGVAFPGLSDLDYPFLSWAFIIPGVATAFGSIYSVALIWRAANREPWERKEEEDWEE